MSEPPGGLDHVQKGGRWSSGPKGHDKPPKEWVLLAALFLIFVIRAAVSK